MPRKRGFCYDKEKFSKDLLIELIEGKKKRMSVSNAELGELIGITGQAFGKRLSDANFDYLQLIKLFKRLEVSQAEILKVMVME